MMDPSYNFEFSSEDGAREETNSLQNVVTGSYGYSYAAADQAAQQTADGEGEISGSYSYTLADGTELEGRYTAGKDGFKVENLDEVLAKAAPEAAEDTLGGYQEAA